MTHLPFSNGTTLEKSKWVRRFKVQSSPAPLSASEWWYIVILNRYIPIPSCFLRHKSETQCCSIFLYDPFDLQVNQLPAQDSKARGTVLAYLEESLQPPDLEDTFAHQHSHLEYTPPLDSGICTFGSVSVGSFPDNDVRLLVFHLREEFG
jgi:hypothetical protein